MQQKELIVSWLEGEETMECYFNISINHFLKLFKTLDNKFVLKEIGAHLADLLT